MTNKKYKITISEILDPTTKLDKFGRKMPTEEVIFAAFADEGTGARFQYCGRTLMVNFHAIKPASE